MEERVELVTVDSIKPAWLNLSGHDAEVVEMLAADIRAGGQGAPTGSTRYSSGGSRRRRLDP